MFVLVHMANRKPHQVSAECCLAGSKLPHLSASHLASDIMKTHLA